MLFPTLGTERDGVATHHQVARFADGHGASFRDPSLMRSHSDKLSHTRQHRDGNGDGTVNALDITKVERVIVALDAETPGADANGDGNVNAIDVTKIELIIAGLG